METQNKNSLHSELEKKQTSMTNVQCNETTTLNAKHCLVEKKTTITTEIRTQKTTIGHHLRAILWR